MLLTPFISTKVALTNKVFLLDGIILAYKRGFCVTVMRLIFDLLFLCHHTFSATHFILSS